MKGGVSGFLGMIVLNSQNYADWKIKTENLLIVKDLYEPINRVDIPRGYCSRNGNFSTGRQWPPFDSASM